MARNPTKAHTRWFTPYVFLAPYLVLFSVFVLAPAVYGLWISLHEWDYMLPSQPWVGLDNYVDLFDSESLVFGDFWSSMSATGIFTVASVPFLVVIPLGIALLLNRKFPGRNVFRAIYFAPYVLGVAVVGLLWRFLLDPNIGGVNYLLGLLGLPDDIAWVNSLPWGWIALVGMTVWWTLGFNAVIYLAGLQDVPRHLYEAAELDGATAWQRFWHVTLPGLRPVTAFVVTVTILASANMFGQSYLVTQGAPGDDTRTAIMYIAEEGLRAFRMGNAAAMGFVLALILGVISVLNFRLLRYKE
ncbi:carbohydrate ABC transporter permease [Stackebrandtia nassauensis]|uniref:Binding-protein-dependent transport systems inner membrane component n=1 Tax=Stackebrandtia nassauensis (strain DSM 44728 / CIP 108903 / NRRL B-16338 / NBRC 102104 / LLR-40K-21) TaxID=446470 RepID=D3Q1S5_STANL|nr:sugar ABC transporter permease [Stackebrandtia nassauensis]ADD39923.1 binding-protein-dependent transport systems inner membrane component [Stackebrandtia nassauensis DSM 44728]